MEAKQCVPDIPTNGGSGRFFLIFRSHVAVFDAYPSDTTASQMAPRHKGLKRAWISGIYIWVEVQVKVGIIKPYLAQEEEGHIVSLLKCSKTKDFSTKSAFFCNFPFPKSTNVWKDDIYKTQLLQIWSYQPFYESRCKSCLTVQIAFPKNLEKILKPKL